MKPLVKICGINDLNVLNALVAMSGIDFLGFIFYENSPRNVPDDLINVINKFDFQNKRPVCVYVDADEYFYSRPRGSRIGAWASKQSSLLKSRKDFIDRVKFYEKKFFKKEIPRPCHWTGIKILPKEFEFWKQGKFRMHERELYFLRSKKWEKKLLYP